MQRTPIQEENKSQLTDLRSQMSTSKKNLNMLKYIDSHILMISDDFDEKLDEFKIACDQDIENLNKSFPSLILNIKEDFEKRIRQGKQSGKL